MKEEFKFESRSFLHKKKRNDISVKMTVLENMKTPLRIGGGIMD